MVRTAPDLEGKKIGMLTVGKRVYIDGVKKICYECVCDCGNTCIRRSDNLLKETKHPHSCGCSITSVKIPSKKRIDMTGKRYDHLVVTKMMYAYNEFGDTYCECVCDCGNTYTINAANLRKKHSYPRNCGCMRYEHRMDQADKSRQDLTGKRFGRLVVKEMIYERNKQTLAVCECDCGNTITTKIVYLNNGDTKSCGCLKRDASSECNTKDFTGVVSPYGIEIIKRHSQTDRGVWMWECKCGECGEIFVDIPARVTGGHVTSCGCAKRSSGERLVRDILESLDVNYIPEKRFDDCKDKKCLPFDFYLPDYNVVIEYQGRQHYKPVSLFGGEESFNQLTLHDKMKQDYCREHDINLIHIDYTEKPSQIREKLTSIIYPERLSYCG